MKSDSENIPAALFDWLEKYNFSSLDSAQQSEVLEYFSAEEYSELRQSVLSIESVKQNDAISGLRRPEPLATARRVLRKQELLNRFDEKHRKPAIAYRFLNRPIALWKAAAVFLLFGSGWMTHYFLREKAASPEPVIAVMDTMYVTKEAMPVLEKIYDTVYIKQQAGPSSIRKIYYKGRREETVEKDESSFLPGDMNVLSIKDLDSTPNRQKSNSIKDDSLLKKYPFVSVL